MPKYEVPGTHTRFTDLQGTASPCRAKAPPLAKRGQDAHATAGETPTATSECPNYRARIMKGRPFEGMVRWVALTTKLTAQRSTL
jgi:hypothetical protein